MRTDISVVVSATRFQEFDHGKPITQLVPKYQNLKKGEVVFWDCAQFDGTLEVIAVGEEVGDSVWCMLKKRS